MFSFPVIIKHVKEIMESTKISRLVITLQNVCHPYKCVFKQ